MAHTAIVPGSFDPLTNGHLDIFAAALEMADCVVVAIGVHPQKSALFTLDERTEMIREVTASLPGGERIAVVAFDGLIVEAARAAGATLLVRGLRDASDFDYEMRMTGTNAVLAPDIRTVFIPAAEGARHLSATLVRQIAGMGGDISAFVPEPVLRRMTEGSG